MATSGSTNFSQTGTQIINHAFYLLGIVAEGKTPTAGQTAFALNALELMVKSLGATGRLWLRTETTQALTASDYDYTMAAGARKVLSVRRIVSSNAIEMQEMAREEYFSLPSRTTATGYPVQWYFDYQRASRVLYVWPVPDATVASNTTLAITYARVLEDMDAVGNEPDFPQEWLEALAYGLAKRLGPRYGQANDPSYREIKEQADLLLGGLAAIDQETASVFLQVGGW